MAWTLWVLMSEYGRKHFLERFCGMFAKGTDGKRVGTYEGRELCNWDWFQTVLGNEPRLGKAS